MSPTSPWQQSQRSARFEAVLAAHGLSAIWRPSSSAWLRGSPPRGQKTVHTRCARPPPQAGSGQQILQAKPGPLVKADKCIGGRLSEGTKVLQRESGMREKSTTVLEGWILQEISPGKAGEMKATKEGQSWQAWDLSEEIWFLVAVWPAYALHVGAVTECILLCFFFF